MASTLSRGSDITDARHFLQWRGLSRAVSADERHVVGDLLPREAVH